MATEQLICHIIQMDSKERVELISRLQDDALKIAHQFGLQYRKIQAEHPRVKSRYGVCYQDGLIKIRLNHAKTGKPLKYSSLIDTLCHELAHLKHFNHGPEFKAFFFRLLNWARRQGIYRPGPRPSKAPAPKLLGPRIRNGVPIFDSDEKLTLDLKLPWENKPKPRRSPKTVSPNGRKPQQLSLF